MSIISGGQLWNLWFDLKVWYTRSCKTIEHYNDVIIGAMASYIISLIIVYSTVYSRRRSKKTPKLRVTGLWGKFTGDRRIPRTKMFPFENWNMVEFCYIHHKVSVLIYFLYCNFYHFFIVWKLTGGGGGGGRVVGGGGGGGVVGEWWVVGVWGGGDTVCSRYLTVTVLHITHERHP